MGAWVMKKLKIGYWPLSRNLNSPGDRRRLVFWAQARGHEIFTDLSQKVDVIVASENSDFNSPYFAKKRTPVIFDLVDAYLSPLSTYDDLARGIAKRVSGQINGSVKPFSHHIRDFCLNSNAVICSSKEQEEVIQPYNTNTHVILDSHDEIPFIDASRTRIQNTDLHRILWEGQPATIRGVKSISPALLELSKTISLRLDFVTDEKYFRLLNKYFERSTLNLLIKDLAPIADFVNIVPWTSSNLVDCAKGSEIAMIPIDLSVPMQRLKPENRLLIMWRLGLPCLTSPSPAYVRVASHAGVTAACNSLQEWFENFNRLITDPKHAKREILAGQNYIIENHNRAILLNKWDLAFESVVN
jgi:hypothetical protein